MQDDLGSYQSGPLTITRLYKLYITIKSQGQSSLEDIYMYQPTSDAYIIMLRNVQYSTEPWIFLQIHLRVIHIDYIRILLLGKHRESVATAKDKEKYQTLLWGIKTLCCWAWAAWFHGLISSI